MNLSKNLFELVLLYKCDKSLEGKLSLLRFDYNYDKFRDDLEVIVIDFKFEIFSYEILGVILGWVLVFLGIS